jgi:hypothetical protein
VTHRESARDALYTAFGLRITSQIELPELARGDTTGPADVEIDFGAVEAALEGGKEIEPGVTATADTLLLDYAPARYLVRAGRAITIDPKPGTSERDIRSYLLGSAIGGICHQRGLLPLHANAVEVGGQAIAFAGSSGAGKSTLAAYFRNAGRRLLCDDVCAVSFNPAGKPLAWPGIPRIKLWGDALAAFGRVADGLERVYDGEDKFSLPFPPDPPLTAFPLRRIYLLSIAVPDSAPAIRPLSGAEAFNAVISNIYRWEFAAPLGRSQTHFANVVSMLGSTEVFAAERRWGFDVFEAEAERLERHIGREDEAPFGLRRAPAG